MWRISRLALYLFISFAGEYALASEEPLTLEEVKGLVLERFPLLMSAQQDIAVAEGELRSAQGKLDINWKLQHESIPDGPYENERFYSVIEQPTTLWGTTFYGGYENSTGEFPVYDKKYETNPGGEALAGVRVPVWRDGAIDGNRAKIQKSKIGIDLAKMYLTDRQLRSIEMVAHLYWDWVRAANRIKIYEGLLKTAESRDVGLEQRVKLGDLPEIEWRENQRAILSRKSRVVSARRELEQVSIKLSLFLRDVSGKMVVIDDARLPPEIPKPDKKDIPARLLDLALERRPDLKSYDLKKQQVDISRSLARNQQGPKIDLRLQMARSFNPDDPEREPPRMEAGLMLEIPLQANIARGQGQSAAAKARQLDIEERYTRDKIANEVDNLQSALSAAKERYELASEEARLARDLEKGEREKFRQGASNQLIVNIREQATADAAMKRIASLVDYHKSLASLYAAIGEVK